MVVLRRYLLIFAVSVVPLTAHAANKIKFTDGSSGVLTALNAVNSDASISGIVRFMDSYGNSKTGSVVLRRSTAGLALTPVILSALQNAGIMPQKDASGNYVTDSSGYPVLVKTSTGTATYTACGSNQTLPLCSDSTKTASARGGLDCYQLNQVNGKTEIFYTQTNPNFDSTWLNQFGAGSTAVVTGAAYIAGSTCALSQYYKTTRPQSAGSLSSPELPSTTTTATDADISTALSTQSTLQNILSPLAQSAQIPDDFFAPVTKTADLTNETSTGDSKLSDDAENTEDSSSYDAIDKLTLETFDLRNYFNFSGNWLPRSCIRSPEFTFSVGPVSKTFQLDTTKMCEIASGLIAPASDIAAVVIFLVIVFRARASGG